MASLNLKKYAGTHFIKPDDVRDRPLRRKIAGIVEGKFGKPDLTFDNGEVLSLNATNVNVLRRVYGDDSKALIEKVVELSLGKLKYNGADHDAVLLKPITPPEEPQAADDAPPPDRPDFDDKIPF